PVPAAAAIVNGARDKFLPGARLSQQEHSRIACRHHFHEFQHLPEGGTLPDDSFEACLGTELSLCIEVIIQAARSLTPELGVSIVHIRNKNPCHTHGHPPKRVSFGHRKSLRPNAGYLAFFLPRSTHECTRGNS